MKQSGDLSVDELYRMADELCQKWWGIQYDGVLSLVNRRWKRVVAYFMPVKLEENGEWIGCVRFSSRRNKERTKSEVRSALLHELVHWYLWKQGKPYMDDTQEFVVECKRVGAPFSITKSAQRAMRLYQ
ncbi:hypothetical protein JNUCC42_13310 [Brevibacterium sp. JNUCC-42]|nr:hypothetical protein JNUCC42_13310 [Brevibacterium sp. JNUCC-42]